MADINELDDNLKSKPSKDITEEELLKILNKLEQRSIKFKKWAAKEKARIDDFMKKSKENNANI